MTEHRHSDQRQHQKHGNHDAHSEFVFRLQIHHASRFLEKVLMKLSTSGIVFTTPRDSLTLGFFSEGESQHQMSKPRGSTFTVHFPGLYGDPSKEITGRQSFAITLCSSVRYRSAYCAEVRSSTATSFSAFIETGKNVTATPSSIPCAHTGPIKKERKKRKYLIISDLHFLLKNARKKTKMPMLDPYFSLLLLLKNHPKHELLL